MKPRDKETHYTDTVFFIFYCVEQCGNKKREYLKGETNEPEASSKNEEL
jgi:hypothetical protein